MVLDDKDTWSEDVKVVNLVQNMQTIVRTYATLKKAEEKIVDETIKSKKFLPRIENCA